MSAVHHHLPDWLIRDYVTGRLARPFALVVAAHVSLCDACRAQMESEEVGGSLMMEALPMMAPSAVLRDRVLAALDVPDPLPKARRPAQGIYPGAIMAELKGRAPRWRALGGGIKQAILSEGAEGSARLLCIPPGRAVLDHSHDGLELTLVLQGMFEDETGRFAKGNVEVAEGDLEHQPIAGPGEACICLAATDAPLRFSQLIPRLLQPIFQI